MYCCNTAAVWKNTDLEGIMDKRWQKRLPVTLNIIINYPALGLLSGTAVNLSNDGMYITTAAASICDYTDIDLIICLPELSDTPFHIPAMVIYSDEKGIGVMFKENQHFTKGLLRYINSEVSPSTFPAAC